MVVYLVGSRFGQVVSKIQDWQISSGIAFTIGANQFHFPKKRPQNPVTGIKDGVEEMEHEFSSVRNIPSGKTDLPFQMFRCSRTCSMKRPKKSFSICFCFDVSEVAVGEDKHELKWRLSQL